MMNNQVYNKMAKAKKKRKRPKMREKSKEYKIIKL
jgi:hypothetical protein